ncbi:MAG: murein transglycosylase A [Campylobacterales bacterium]|nr:murein transglycosylase A [Campylobacterales bacterium]
MNKKIYILPLLLMSLFIIGCGQKVYTFKNISKANMHKIEFKDLKGFYEDDLDLALEVFKKSCKRSARQKNFKKVCNLSLKTTNAKDFFTKNFTAYKLLNKDSTDQGTITGYYEPLLQGSLIKTNIYKYAIYKIPKNMLIIDFSSEYPKLKKYRLRGRLDGNKVKPYYTRAEIIKRDELEVIAYVDNKVDLFFLHIQGSGRVQLRDKSIINVAYANQNGRKYKSVGRYMIRKGYIGNGIDASMQGMKKWFAKNPLETDRVLNHNQSFIFFSQSKRAATGSLGVELTAERNLAVDRKFIPLGMPVFIQTKNPLNKKEINQLMLAADTGGAIKGDIRADFFYGFGPIAESKAGRMKEKGKLILLIPNDIKAK